MPEPSFSPWSWGDPGSSIQSVPQYNAIVVGTPFASTNTPNGGYSDDSTPGSQIMTGDGISGGPKVPQYQEYQGPSSREPRDLSDLFSYFGGKLAALPGMMSYYFRGSPGYQGGNGLSRESYMGKDAAPNFPNFSIGDDFWGIRRNKNTPLSWSVAGNQGDVKTLLNNTGITPYINAWPYLVPQFSAGNFSPGITYGMALPGQGVMNYAHELPPMNYANNVASPVDNSANTGVPDRKTWGYFPPNVTVPQKKPTAPSKQPLRYAQSSYRGGGGGGGRGGRSYGGGGGAPGWYIDMTTWRI